MPIIKSAKKALRQENRRAIENQKVRSAYKKAIRFFRENVSSSSLNTAYKKIDQAAKKHIIHKNKASRLKSQLARFLKENSKKKVS
jgi:small subunit ribosomal protein S20